MAGWGLCKGVGGLSVSTTACAGWLLAAQPVLADTLEGALVLAYQNNPTLNAQRASVRATDEGVPQALAGYRPRVSFNGSGGPQYTDFNARDRTFMPNYQQLSGTMTPRNYGLTATQTLYNGFQTPTRTRQGGGRGQAARE